MRILPTLLFTLFICSVGLGAAENRITMIATGAGNSFAPTPLPDGRVLFVTDRADNLDLAIWSKGQAIKLWERHSADDFSPRLLDDGKTVIFRSDRGTKKGTWWQRPLTKLTAHPLTQPPVWNRARFHIERPVDSNADGQINALDSGWIVDTQTGLALTPLVLNAANPVISRDGRLWFSLLHKGLRRIAFIAHPHMDITPDDSLASWQQWQMLLGVRHALPIVEQAALIWDAGYRKSITSHESGTAIPAQWQRLRAKLYTDGSRQAEVMARAWLRHAVRLHHPYADRMHFDLAMWLKQQGHGAKAIAQLNLISRQPWKQRAALLRAELLIGSGHAMVALKSLARLNIDTTPYLHKELLRISGIGLKHLAKAADTIAQLRLLLGIKHSSSYLRSSWQMQLAARYLALGGYEAGLALLSREAGHPLFRNARRALRLRLLTHLANEKLKSGLLNDALELTRQAIMIDATNVYVARLHFRMASSLNQINTEARWWQKQIVKEHAQSPKVHYIAALILTYQGNHLHRAEKVLRAVVRAMPDLWPAYQTLGWVLEQHQTIKSRREALEAYQTAYSLAAQQHTEADEMIAIRSNLINLMFILQLYDQQLDLMHAWQADGTHIPAALLIQAAKACFKISHASEGLDWLDRLPDSLGSKQRNRVLRLRALLADQDGNHTASVRALSLLLADPELDTSLRERLLLNRALAYTHGQQMGKAQRDLTDLARMPPAHDQVGKLRLDGSTLAFDSAWVASSLRAEIRQHRGAWLAFSDSLKQKLAKKGAPAYVQGVIHQNLAVSYIRQGLWEQAKKQLLLSEGLLKKRNETLYYRVLWMRVRLVSALGNIVDGSSLSRLAQHFKDDPQHALEIELLRLSQSFSPVHGNSLQGSMTFIAGMRERMHAWRNISQRAERDYPELSGWVDLQYLRWLEHYGNDDVAATLRRRIASNPKADPWLKWWLKTESKTASNSNAKSLKQLIAHTDTVLPIHLSMVDHYFQTRASAFLQQDRQGKALGALIERERNITRLRHQAIKSRPLPPSKSMRQLRRELRPDEAMLLIWPVSTTGQSELWWMDHGHVLYKHIHGSSAAEWFKAVRVWQAGKKRLFLSFVQPSLQDFEAFRKAASGQRIVLSPTLIHAVGMGRIKPDQSAFASASWQETLWQQADASLMDWKWHLKEGMAAYRQHRWADAMDALEQVLGSVLRRNQSRLLLLIGKAAFNGGLEGRALAIFEHTGALPASLKPVRLRLQAVVLEQQGQLSAAAAMWLRLFKQKADWRNRSLAANALTSLSLRGIVQPEVVNMMITKALAALPRKALIQQRMLEMDRMRLINQFHPKDGWSAFETAFKAVSRRITAHKDSTLLRQLKLMRIEASWKYDKDKQLFSSLDALQHEIPDKNPLRFDLANLRALIQQSMGQTKAARISFLQARHALMWVSPSVMNERLAGWHNNMGRLDLVMEKKDEALAHFRAAIDVDKRRGDRIGLLYDWKNLGRLLVHTSFMQRKEGVSLLQKGLHQARAMQLPQLEAAFLFSLLAIRDEHSRDHAGTMMQRFATLVGDNSNQHLQWALDWFQAEISLAQGQKADAIASLKQSITTIQTANVQLADVKSPFSPLHVYEQLIALLFEHHSGQALAVAAEVRHLILAQRFHTSFNEPEHRAPADLHDHVRLVYFTGAKTTWCWLMDATGIRSKKLNIGYDTLHKTVVQLNTAASRRLPVKIISKRLAKQIWYPLRSWLAHSGTVEVIAIGPLEKMSFAMLHSGKAWLIQRYAFSYPMSVFSQTTRDSMPGTRMALISNAGAGDQALPLVAQELEAIRDFSRQPTVVVSKPAAFYLPQLTRYTQWLHLAGHIHIAPHHPGFSYIQFQPGTHEEGLLHVNTLLTQKLKLNTVVLSGCGSQGENPFAQAFLLAGSRQTVADVMAGSDLSLSLFMKAFYRALAKKEPIVRALQTAQQWMQTRYPDPIDWAGIKLTFR